MPETPSSLAHLIETRKSREQEFDALVMSYQGGRDYALSRVDIQDVVEDIRLKRSATPDMDVSADIEKLPPGFRGVVIELLELDESVANAEALDTNDTEVVEKLLAHERYMKVRTLQQFYDLLKEVAPKNTSIKAMMSDYVLGDLEDKDLSPRLLDLAKYFRQHTQQ